MGPGDVLVEGGRISAIGKNLKLPLKTDVIDAAGAALLSGLNDHHIHLASLAASQDSLFCGPPGISNEIELTTALQRLARSRPEGAWLRGIGFHDSVAGDIDRSWLDARIPHYPVRIQHRGGRLWVFNTRALERLHVTEDDPLERKRGKLTGRLYEGDVWLRKRMQDLEESGPPDLSKISLELASYGITGITDTTPSNNPDTLAWFAGAQQRGELLQEMLMMGNETLDGVVSDFPGIVVGHHKFHLLESDLPDMEKLVSAIRRSHAAGRNVAFHCVTRTELVFALATLQEAGCKAGDRIEHASVTPPEWLKRIRDMGLTVVTQPAFVYERGDQYLAEVEKDDQPWLYRLRAFLDAGIPLAGSSDAPFTQTNPWKSMQAAVDRRTLHGQGIGLQESLTVDQAIHLYTSPLSEPGVHRTKLVAGDRADLCLLTDSWDVVSRNLAQSEVAVTIRAGKIIWRK